MTETTLLSTQARIFAAARQLFDQGGVEAVSMRRIAAKVGITPMAIYKHYPDKDALLNALMLDGFAAWEARVAALKVQENTPNAFLRLAVSGGGCSGFQYGFTFDEEVNEDDTTMEKNGVTLLIDPMSYQYLVGAEIDYSEGLEGSQFVIRNPNATSTCGCGSSFSA